MDIPLTDRISRRSIPTSSFPLRVKYKHMSKPEVLSPAGDIESFDTALRFKADAVYLAGKSFGMRTASKNFSFEELKSSCEKAHALKKKVYLTCNTLPRNADLPHMPAFLQQAADCGVDAFIIADLGVFEMAKRYAPRVERHISTQGGIINYESALAWYNLGAKRVVLAREMRLDEIAELRAKIPDELEIECFVHGAMCISYSGRCLLSSYLAGRDANRGACTHPCRWRYAVVEETRPGEYMPIEENERGTYIFNSRDLCMVDHLPDLYKAGIDSFKVEGRMKTALYVATAASVYSRAMRDYEADPALYESRLDEYRAQISEGTYRRFTTGFFYGRPDRDALIYDSNTYVKNYIFLGIVEHADEDGCRLTQKNKFQRGGEIEILKPDGRVIPASVLSIRDEDGMEMESAPHPKQKLIVKLSEQAEEYDLLRMKAEE